MGKFLNGLFVGIGVGLLIAPQKGEETRRLIMERAAALRKCLSSEDGQHFLINARPPEVTTFPLQPDQPIATSYGESQELVTPSVPPPEPTTLSSSEAQVSETPSIQPAETPPTLRNQTSNNSDIADTASTSGPTTHVHFVPDTHPDQGTSPETPKTATEDTVKPPTVSGPSNMPKRTAKRKTTPRTSSASKTKGDRRS